MGIDFGTTRTVVVSVDGGNYPVCSFSLEGESKEYIPTLVAVKEGELFFGWDAASLFNEPDTRIIRSMKRPIGEIGPDEPIDLAPGISLPAIELITRFLAYLKEMIIHHGNVLLREGEPIEAMVATPANAGSNQRFITIEAFQRAGFSVLGVMNEPSAASVEYTHRYLMNLGPKSPKRYLVVYDLGGGTFDTSAVAIADRSHEVIAHGGIRKLGGDDFDEIILDLVLEELGVTRLELSPAQTTLLLEECRERKEGLKPNTKRMVVDPAPLLDGRKVAILDTQRIYEGCEPIIRQSLDKLKMVIDSLKQADIDPNDSQALAAVYLVGGAISFPPVSRTLREVYGAKAKVSPYPHAATAIGLAIAADPEARIQMRESVSRHFGVWREDAQGRDKVFDPIFLKDKAVDGVTGSLHTIRQYHPVHNIGHLRYLECSSLGSDNEPEGDIALVRDVYFPYDPALERQKDLKGLPIDTRADLSDLEVKETYVYNAHGLIEVKIENLSSGFKEVYCLES